MRGALPLLLAAIVAGCGYSSKTAESDKVPLSDAPATPADAKAPAPAGALAGSVLQKLDAPPYTYLLVKTTQGETWAAVPQAAVATGANVRVYNPMLMTKFESKALKRTFDEIYFGTLSPDGSDAASAGGPATMADGTNPHAGVAVPPAEPVKVGKVEKAAGADAYTIAEAWARKDALAGKIIAIRGVVVKYNAQVMGKNWVHLQDGSGNAANNTSDITVVTMDETAKGQTITIRGTVKTSKDFGAGYKYAIIIEDAKIVK
ncbi:MAG: nucleotide-binding protein [Gemmatimonas sp.]|nr:nucleotide-binding protein [Gemmatimonas sp.]